MNNSMFFCFCVCVNKSEKPRRSRPGKETMTNSARQERMAANPHMSRRGRGRRDLEEVEISQAAQSQVVNPTPKHAYETWEEGYDPTKKHYVDGPEDPYFQSS